MQEALRQRYHFAPAELGAKQGGTPERRTANRPSANLVNQQQPKRTSTQKLQGRGGWARFVKGLGAVQTRGDARKAYRQPTFGEPCKPTTTKTNLDAEIAGRAGWARFVKGLGAVQTRGDAGKAYRQPTFGEPCKPTTTTNLDAEIARPGGLGEVCQRPGRCSNKGGRRKGVPPTDLRRTL